MASAFSTGCYEIFGQLSLLVPLARNRKMLISA
ncbi:Protein of unknown function [Bacillus cytotoxicus]|nr:Protein of unknown function [Bacillus cytotoxicus]